MKPSTVLLILAMALSFGEALRCNHCIGKGCHNTVVTCHGSSDVCARVIFRPPNPPNHFRRCSSAGNCRLMQSQPSLMSVRCCTTNQCN